MCEGFLVIVDLIFIEDSKLKGVWLSALKMDGSRQALPLGF